ncbi:unnamed protein product, partial [Ectocarpus fasciculatus]
MLTPTQGGETYTYTTLTSDTHETSHMPACLTSTPGGTPLSSLPNTRNTYYVLRLDTAHGRHIQRCACERSTELQCERSTELQRISQHGSRHQRKWCRVEQ